MSVCLYIHFDDRLMIGKKIIPAVVVIIYFFSISAAFAKPSDEDINNLFTSAEILLKSIQGKKYSSIWQSITIKTKKSIVDAVYKESKKRGVDIDKEKINADFAEGGDLAKAYWDSFLNVIDPNTVLEQSKWSIGTIKKDTAEINTLYKKSQNPTVWKLYREDGAWKVGLEETFGARNLLPDW